MKISVCGKGGSGKSTVVTLLARQAEAKGLKVMVIDSDESNSGLFRMLGFPNPPEPLMELVGGKKDILQRIREPNILSEATIRPEEIPSRFKTSRNGLMLVSIGKILQSFEGCACPMGVLSREFLKKLTLEEGETAFIDMEAGVEHFGRGIDEAIDRALIVVEPSFESLAVAEKINELASGMKKRVSAVLNKVPSEEIAERLTRDLESKGIQIIGKVPNDPAIFASCLEGDVLTEGAAFDQMGRILDHLL